MIPTGNCNSCEICPPLRDQKGGDMTNEIKRIHLNEWEEVVGVFKGIVEEDPYISIRFPKSELVFNSESKEAKILKIALKEVRIGSRISVLRTDLVENPLIVKVEKQDKDVLHHSIPSKESVAQK